MSGVASIFVNDVVIQNPKQSAVIFAVVVVLSVFMEVLFGFFRDHRSFYVRGLFLQLSEEVVIIGTIGLLFVFLVQSISSMPQSWVLLFQYVQTVIFVMMVLFVAGAVSTVLITRLLYKQIKKYEDGMLAVLRQQQSDLVITHCLGTSSGGGGSTAPAGGSTEESSHAISLKSLLDGNPRDAHAEVFLVHLMNPDVWAQLAPKGTVQQIALSLRRVFVEQTRDRRVTPAPLQLLLCTAEVIRLSSIVAKERDAILRQRRAENKEYQAKFSVVNNGSMLMPLVETADELRIVREKYRSLAGISSGAVPDEASDPLLKKDGLKSDDDDDDVAAAAAAAALGNMSFSSYVDNNVPTSRARSLTLRLQHRQSSAAASVAARDELDVERIKELFEKLWYSRSSRILDPTIICTYAPFSKYLYHRLRTNMITYIDITWQCWLSIILSSSLNSLRLFMLPSLQEKSPSDFTPNERLGEHLSFIFLIGYTPAIAFTVGFVLQARKFFQYLGTIRHHQDVALASSQGAPQSPSSPAKSGEGRFASSLRRLSAVADYNMMDQDSLVWLPPRQAAGVLSGDLYDDPSRYLLRGNRAFTLHMFKVPGLLVQFYFSMFIVGVWGDISMGSGTLQIALVPIALLPVVVVFTLLPLGLFMVTCLTSLGLRMDKKVVRVSAVRQARQVGQKMASFLKKSGAWAPSLRSERLRKEAAAGLAGGGAQAAAVPLDDDETEREDERDQINFEALIEPLDECGEGESAASDGILVSALERSILGIVRPGGGGGDDGKAVSSNNNNNNASSDGDQQSVPNLSMPRRSSDGSGTAAVAAATAAAAAATQEASELRTRVKALEQLCLVHGIELDSDAADVSPVVKPILAMYRETIARQKDEIRKLKLLATRSVPPPAPRSIAAEGAAVGSVPAAAADQDCREVDVTAPLSEAVLAARKYHVYGRNVDLSVRQAPAHTTPARTLQELHRAAGGIDFNTI